MNFLPIFLDLKKRSCVVIGGGRWRHEGNVAAGGRRPDNGICTHSGRDIRRWAADGKVRHVAQEFRPEVLDGCALVIAATDDKSVNRQVRMRQGAQYSVNVVDQPDLCTFIMPSSSTAHGDCSGVDRGSSPVLARSFARASKP